MITINNLTVRLGGRAILQGASAAILPGGRIGLIGRNGAGKSTLLRMLLGRETPDSGRIKMGFGVEPVYFDQKRAQLNPDDTLWSTLCPGGGDTPCGQRRAQDA